MTERLLGKRILITGAAQGIGLAIAHACLAEGARLFLLDQDGGLLQKSVSDLGAPTGMVASAAVDITDARVSKQLCWMRRTGSVHSTRSSTMPV